MQAAVRLLGRAEQRTVVVAAVDLVRLPRPDDAVRGDAILPRVGKTAEGVERQRLTRPDRVAAPTLSPSSSSGSTRSDVIEISVGVEARRAPLNKQT